MYFITKDTISTQNARNTTINLRVSPYFTLIVSTLAVQGARCIEPRRYVQGGVNAMTGVPTNFIFNKGVCLRFRLQTIEYSGSQSSGVRPFSPQCQ
jgi:hypothetical protein